jgi:CarD family transcriptional regulator
MFKIGDKVVLPLHGAGVISDIVDMMIDGKSTSYYVLSIPVGNLTVTVPVDGAQNRGMRAVHTKDEVIEIVNNAGTVEMTANWAQRNKDNTAILKQGNLLNIVEIYKTLILRERVRSLSSIEKKLLSTTKQVILTEMVLALDVDKSEAVSILSKSIPQGA